MDRKLANVVVVPLRGIGLGAAPVKIVGVGLLYPLPTELPVTFERKRAMLGGTRDPRQWRIFSQLKLCKGRHPVSPQEEVDPGRPDTLLGTCPTRLSGRLNDSSAAMRL